MKRLTDLEYLKLSKLSAIMYNIGMFFAAIPGWIWGGILKLFGLIKSACLWLKDEVVDIVNTFVKGNWAVKLSFLVFGFGNLYYGQIMRGVLFLLFEIIFVVYMILPSGGAYWLSKVNWFQTGETVGTVQGGKVVEYVEYNGMQIPVETWVAGDDSVKVLL